MDEEKYLDYRLSLLCFQGELCIMPSELDVQMEVERLSVRDFSREQQDLLAKTELYEPSPPNSNESRDTQTTADSKAGKKKKNK